MVRVPTVRVDLLEDGRLTVSSRQPDSKKAIVCVQAQECAAAARPLPSVLLQEAVRCLPGIDIGEGNFVDWQLFKENKSAFQYL